MNKKEALVISLARIESRLEIVMGKTAKMTNEFESSYHYKFRVESGRV